MKTLKQIVRFVAGLPLIPILIPLGLIAEYFGGKDEDILARNRDVRLRSGNKQ